MELLLCRSLSAAANGVWSSDLALIDGRGESVVDGRGAHLVHGRRVHGGGGGQLGHGGGRAGEGGGEAIEQCKPTSVSRPSCHTVNTTTNTTHQFLSTLYLDDAW